MSGIIKPSKRGRKQTMKKIIIKNLPGRLSDLRHNLYMWNLAQSVIEQRKGSPFRKQHNDIFWKLAALHDRPGKPLLWLKPRA